MKAFLLTTRIKRIMQFEHAWLRKVIKGIWILFFAMLAGVPGYLSLVIHNPYNLFGPMPSLHDIANPKNDLASEIISADGVVLGRYFRQNRSEVSYDELPPLLVNALITSEDHRFYRHSGMDFISWLRVAIGILTFSSQGGGSTITQQTAKNLFGTREAQLRGKLSRLGSPIALLISKTKEWIISVKLEQTFTKDEIIAIYLNTVPFSQNAYGIKTAAETYFSKPLTTLNIQETALLVGMLQGINRFNPVYHPDRARQKRNEVLRKLYAHRYIKTKQELDSLSALPVELHLSVQSHNRGLATHFRNVLRNEVQRWCKVNGYDLRESGLKIYTTIDSRMQRLAEEAVAQHMRALQKDFDMKWGSRNPWIDNQGRELRNFTERKIKQTGLYKNLVTKYGENSDSVNIMLHIKKRMKVFTWQGERDTLLSSIDSLKHYNRFLHTGFMAMNPATGAIKAWVGGINYKYFQFDHVRQAKRQPGSTFKAFVYAKAMEDGYSPCYELRDVSPMVSMGRNVYHARNFDGTHGDGQIYSLRKALTKSLNSITIQMMDRLQPANVAAFAQRLGISGKLPSVYSLALGAVEVSLEEMVGAYSVFVNQGIYTRPYYITRIEDKDGNVIVTFIPERKQVINESTAEAMVHMLKGGVDEPQGSLRALSHTVRSHNEVGGKTGTTNNGSDGWFVGITHNLVTGIWVGGNEQSIRFPTWESGSGFRTALPLWDLFMQKVYAHPEIGYTKGNFQRSHPEASRSWHCPDYAEENEGESDDEDANDEDATW